MSEQLKALVIRDDARKLSDLGQVLAFARAQGHKLFKTHENIRVIRAIYENDIGWVVVIGRSKPLVESGREKIGK